MNTANLRAKVAATFLKAAHALGTFIHWIAYVGPWEEKKYIPVLRVSDGKWVKALVTSETDTAYFVEVPSDTPPKASHLWIPDGDEVMVLKSSLTVIQSPPPRSPVKPQRLRSKTNRAALRT